MRPREIWNRLRTWMRRDELDAQVAAELEDHVELLARDLEREGLTPAEARAKARRKVGNLTSQRETSRDAWGFPRLDIVLQDVRYTLRGLRRSPLFTITAVLTLGLGIGANAAMFAVVDRLMFRPLPYLADPANTGRVYLQVTPEGRRITSTTMPYTRFRDIAELASRSFETIAGVSEWRLAVGVGADTRIRKVAGISASTWSLFNARPVQGRFFGAADDQVPGGNEVAVLGNAYWQSDFGARDVVGEKLRVGMRDFTIVGVAPPGFSGPTTGRAVDIFVPISTIPLAMTTDSASRFNYYRDYRWDWVEVVARRRQGISPATATADLTHAYSESRSRARLLNPRVLVDSVARPVAFAGPVRTAAGPDAGLESRVLLWVSGVALVVLLIACANVANLMLARILRRRREIALRLALGVSRARLASQFVIEALSIAAAGAVAGLVIAQWTGTGIRALLLPEGSSFNLAADGRTISVAIAVSILAALLTVIVPIALAMRSELSSSLKAGARDGGYRGSWLRTTLLIVQGALSVALLVGAGLFVQSLDHVRQIPLGFDVSTVLDVQTDFRGDEASDSSAKVALRRRLLAAAQAIPGVEAASRVNSTLFQTSTAALKVAGIDSVEKLGRFSFQFTGPDYFRVMRTRILRGRGFNAGDREGSAPVTVVSAAMAHRLWPREEALGQCVRVTFGDASPKPAQPCVTVVGIAEDIASVGITDTARYVYYLPVDQVNPSWGSTMYVRVTDRDVDAAIERVRRAMQAQMPGNGFVIVTPLQQRVDDQQRSWRLGALLFLGFGTLALIVAAVGLYGVTGYDVAQRMHELGVRVALGAGKGDIVKLVVGHAAAITLTAVVIGAALALSASRWIQPLLYKQSARDPLTYTSIAAVMLLVAIAAATLPAIRAARVDPNRALRAE